MNYQKIYDDLIETRKKRVLISEYYEKHHIIPVSMGGSNTKDNLVDLTAREHFLAHWLLWRIHRNRKMACAFMLMCRNCSSARGYEEARKSLSQIPMKPETRERMSKFAKTRLGEKNGFFGKKHSEQIREKWRIDRKGKASTKRKPVIQYDLISGEILTVYSSLQEASQLTGICVASIYFSCQNPQKKVRKQRTFSFRYL